MVRVGIRYVGSHKYDIADVSFETLDEAKALIAGFMLSRPDEEESTIEWGNNPLGADVELVLP